MINELERAADALHFLDSGCPREDWVKAGMSAKSAGLGFDDFHHWSASAGNYANENECRTVWKSFSENGGVTPATLFGMAFAQGWQDPAKSSTKGKPISKPAPSPQKPLKPSASPIAAEIWGRCIPADVSDAYICTKKGTPAGLRLYPASAPALAIRGQNVAGYLAVPCWSGADLQTIQFIPPAGGDKLNLPGASFGSGFFTVGEITDRVYIVEGVGQAWACHAATGAAAVCCFGAGRMPTVATALREKYPDARLVIVPDKGKEIQAADIAAAVAGSWVALPADKPQNYDCNDFAAEHGTDALAALLERPQAPPMRYNLLTDGDLAKLPPMQWRIKGVLPAEGLAAAFGASGSGKSFLVLDMLQSLAAGADWFGHRVTPCPVIYCALEGEGGIAGRVNAYRIRHGSTSEHIRYLVQPFSLLDGGDIHDLAQAIKASGNGAGVVVLDTLNRAAPGADENDSKSMGQIIAAAKQLQTLVGGLVLLVHHTGKDASKGLRGHSSLHAALDAAIEVRRDGDNREWLIAKSKDGEDGATHPFKLDVVELGNDQDGEPITSCVVRPVEAMDASIRRALPPKSGNQRTVWDALGEIFRKAGGAKPEGAPDTLPQGRPCVTLEDAIDKTRARLVCDPKRQTERTQAAIRGLVERGLLQHEAGFLWCK
ncbi:MAG: AAA family ATPase [Sulfurimicrobium sp.]|nr:AAA family ATPase [Sulfurimicrobium sp.]